MKKKGYIMTQLIKNCGDYDIAFPLDIDEFIVYYNREENRIYPKKTLKKCCLEAQGLVLN